MKTSEVLGEAADVIVRNGWTRDEYFTWANKPSDECPVCVLGAINIAARCDPEEWEYDDAVHALARHLGIDAGPLNFEIVIGNLWNDVPDRTAEQVIAALRATAATEREAGR